MGTRARWVEDSHMIHKFIGTCLKLEEWLKTAPANNFLYAGNHLANNILFAGRSPINNFLSARGPPANKFLFAGGPLANNLFQRNDKKIGTHQTLEGR